MLETHRIIAPVEKPGQFVFDELGDPARLRLDYPTTSLPPKKALLPPTEKLLNFTADTITPVFDLQPTVILGLHTCDLHAILLLDRIYGQGYADRHYQMRRQNTLLVSIECLQPCGEAAFCKSMGTLSAVEGYDLHLTDLGEAYAIDVGSEAGRSLLADCPLKNPGLEDYARLNQTLAEKWPRFPYRLEREPAELANVLAVSFNSDLWQELGEKCLGCGACTAVCPTCQCFTVQDDVDFSTRTGSRYRRWDGCPLTEFALVAGGHNFRPANAERQRHRFFRKGKYMLEANGLVGCIGCGRCARACLAGINPVEVYNQLAQRMAQKV